MKLSECCSIFDTQKKNIKCYGNTGKPKDCRWKREEGEHFTGPVNFKRGLNLVFRKDNGCFDVSAVDADMHVFKFIGDYGKNEHVEKCMKAIEEHHGEYECPQSHFEHAHHKTECNLMDGKSIHHCNNFFQSVVGKEHVHEYSMSLVSDSGWFQKPTDKFSLRISEKHQEGHSSKSFFKSLVHGLKKIVSDAAKPDDSEPEHPGTADHQIGSSQEKPSESSHIHRTPEIKHVDGHGIHKPHMPKHKPHSPPEKLHNPHHPDPHATKKEPKKHDPKRKEPKKHDPKKKEPKNPHPKQPRHTKRRKSHRNSGQKSDPRSISFLYVLISFALIFPMNLFWRHH